MNKVELKDLDTYLKRFDSAMEYCDSGDYKPIEEELGWDMMDFLLLLVKFYKEKQ